MNIDYLRYYLKLMNKEEKDRFVFKQDLYPRRNFYIKKRKGYGTYRERLSTKIKNIFKGDSSIYLDLDRTVKDFLVRHLESEGISFISLPNYIVPPHYKYLVIKDEKEADILYDKLNQFVSNKNISDNLIKVFSAIDDDRFESLGKQQQIDTLINFGEKLQPAFDEYFGDLNAVFSTDSMIEGQNYNQVVSYKITPNQMFVSLRNAMVTNNVDGISVINDEFVRFNTFIINKLNVTGKDGEVPSKYEEYLFSKGSRKKFPVRGFRFVEKFIEQVDKEYSQNKTTNEDGFLDEINSIIL